MTGSVSAQKQQTLHSGYPIDPVPFTSVKVTDSFWGQRLKASREVTIPLAFSKCEETGRYENFVKATHPSDEYKVGGFSFDDTDVYKTIEGASYSLQTYPDKKLEEYIDSVLVIVAAAQEPDGYLYTARTMNPKHPHDWSGPERWSEVENLSHEFYNLGHMVEGAVAYYQATDKRNFLDIAIRYADCVCKNIGEGPGQKRVIPGHQIAEMALVRLYTVTGDKKYLDQAKFFLDARGTTARKDIYLQSHKPVLEQEEAVGHAVRAGYMYSGMADVAAITGDSSYIKAIDKIWENIVGKKIYITGGIGARHAGEAFGDNYELPNLTAYNETCAAIGNVYMNYRLFLLHGDSKYFDVLERTLYNGLISGVSLDGGKFFYPNPLSCDGKYHFNADHTITRQPWFGCACCPGNVTRFVASVPSYAYATQQNDIYVNLYIQGKAEMQTADNKVTLEQTTEYPWNGKVTIKVTPEKEGEFAIRLRIPGWTKAAPVASDLYAYTDAAKKYTLKVNGSATRGAEGDGYETIVRTWKAGDVIELEMPMDVRRIKANDKVEVDRGMVALERGPIMFCLEGKDQPDSTVFNKFIPSDTPIEASYDANLLNGVMVLKGTAKEVEKDGTVKDVAFKAIPYSTWNNRGADQMEVWIPESKEYATPTPEPTIASKAKTFTIQAAIQKDAPESAAVMSYAWGVNDQWEPKRSSDTSKPYFYWWLKNGTMESLAYEFDKPYTVSKVEVYWLDFDHYDGDFRVPQSWTLYYKSGNAWKEVETSDKYGVEKDKYNVVNFKPVQTTGLKISAQLQKGASGGIIEWKVE